MKNKILIIDDEEIIRKRIEKELQAGLEKLEKFTKVAVGREEKMVELKKEIKRLKSELETKK